MIMNHHNILSEDRCLEAEEGVKANKFSVNSDSDVSGLRKAECFAKEYSIWKAMSMTGSALGSHALAYQCNTFGNCLQLGVTHPLVAPN